MADKHKKPLDDRETAGYVPDEFEDAETAEVSCAEDLSGADETTGELPGPIPGQGDAAAKDEPRGGLLDAADVLRDRYEIEALEHTGGMGEVYRAIDLRVQDRGTEEARVAIKLLRPALAERPDMRSTLESEAARARRLSHPNIVNVFDFDEEDGRFFLVMEWLDGESLKDLLRRTRGKRLDTAFAWRVVDGVARALQHAHANGIVHADVNPSNIFITDTQEIKLLDFGVARDLGADHPDGPVWATARYASPDRLDGLAAEIEDDVFSLGGIAYRLLSGLPPFGDLSPAEARDRRLNPKPVQGLADNDALLLQRALAFDRNERPLSVDPFIRDGVSPGNDDKVPETPDRGDGPAMPWPWLAAGAAAVAVGIIWATWPTPTPEQPTTMTRNQETASNPARANEDAPPTVSTEDGQRSVSDQVATDTIDEPATAAVQTSPLAPGNEVGEASVADEERPLSVAATSSPVIATRSTPGDDRFSASSNSPAVVAPEASAAPAARAAASAIEASEAAGELQPRVTETRSDVAPMPNEAAGEASEERLAAAAGLAAASDALPEPNAGSSGRLSDDPAAIGQAPDAADTPNTLAAPIDTGDEAAGGDTPAAAATGATDALVASSLAAAAVRPGMAAAPERVDFREETPATRSIARVTPDRETEAIAALDGPVDKVAEQPSESAQPALATPASAGAKAQAGPEKIEYTPLSELDLKRYVAPLFPRVARYRDQSGHVDLRFSVRPDGSTADIEIIEATPSDVFVESAETAVSKWRFGRRDEIVTAQVRLSFDLKE